MEQSMQPDSPANLRENDTGDVANSSPMDEDLRMALLLSQDAQQAEENECYQSSQYPTVPRESDRWRTPDDRDRQQQDPSLVQHLERSFPFEEFSVQPMPDNDPDSADDCGDALPTNQPQRKASEEQKDSSLKLSSRPRSLSRQSSFDVDVDEATRIAMVREGQLDTRIAIMQGDSQIVTCQGCMGKLHAPSQCSLVFCPNCNTVTPEFGNRCMI